MVGGLIVSQCLSSDKVDQVTSLVRRNSSHTHPKLHEVVVEDFAGLGEYSEAFEKVDAAFFCIGAYTGGVSDDVFRTITVDYAVVFGAMLSEKSPGARLCLLSGAGADRNEKSRTAFARYKGMAENRLSE